jgi:predicted outer membrane protein
MVRDHAEPDAKLDEIVGSKGVTLPAGLHEKSQRQYDRLQRLSVTRFDRE